MKICRYMTFINDNYPFYERRPRAESGRTAALAVTCHIHWDN